MSDAPGSTKDRSTVQAFWFSASLHECLFKHSYLPFPFTVATCGAKSTAAARNLADLPSTATSARPPG